MTKQKKMSFLTSQPGSCIVLERFSIAISAPDVAHPVGHRVSFTAACLHHPGPSSSTTDGVPEGCAQRGPHVWAGSAALPAGAPPRALASLRRRASAVRWSSLPPSAPQAPSPSTPPSPPTAAGPCDCGCDAAGGARRAPALRLPAQRPGAPPARPLPPPHAW